MRRSLAAVAVFLAALGGLAQEPYAILTGHTGPIWGLDFSPDGRYLVTAGGCFDKIVRLWDVELKMEIYPFKGSIDRVMAVSFSADGKTIASVAPMERAVRLWDVDSGACELLESHAGALMTVSFSPKGSFLTAGAASGKVELWRVSPEGYTRLFLLSEPTDEVEDVAFSPDETLLAAAAKDGNVYIWDIATGKLVVAISAHEGGARGVAFSPDGKLIATCGTDYLVKIWEGGSWRLLRALEGHRWFVNDVSFSPDGRILASACSDGTIILWDPASGEALATLKGHRKPVTGVAFSPGGKLLASSSADKTVILWDMTGFGEPGH